MSEDKSDRDAERKKYGIFQAGGRRQTTPLKTARSGHSISHPGEQAGGTAADRFPRSFLPAAYWHRFS